ncbi:MAG: hypothetical protein ACJ75B_00560 [Flavisolibacter sp.]
MVSAGASKWEQTDQPPAVRIGARIISYLFHPLFLPLYLAWFMIYEARLFPERTSWEKTIVLIQFFVYYTFLPLITTLLSKGLGFIQSIHLRTQKDRILPYVVCEIFYFWAWYVFRNLHFPKPIVLFGLSVFLACSLGLLINAYIKVSMHAISVGVLSALLLITGNMSSINYGPYISIALLISGLTGTARLIDSNHSTTEVYTGFFAGVIVTVVAYFFV